MSDLPNWPKYGDKGYTRHAPCGSLGDEVFDAEKFERAKTRFWETRCRIAVGILGDIESRSCFDLDGIVQRLTTTGALSDHAAKALEIIGELPKERA